MTSIERVLKLIKKTGDRAIILTETGDSAYVIMGISDYEQLILGKAGVEGLTEDELLAKINREIAIWKDSQKIQGISIDQYDFSQDLGELNGPELLQKDGEDEDRYYFEPVE